MKIYTRTGDGGSTGLFGGPRVPKDDARIEACGTVDELNAALGVVRSLAPPPAIEAPLEQIQHELFSIGAELATPAAEDHGLRIIADDHISRLERWIDQHEAELSPLRQFILPAGDPVASQLHVARAICRRAERRVVTMSRQTSVSQSPVVYLNRLSDLLFVLARAANRSADVAEFEWKQPE